MKNIPKPIDENENVEKNLKAFFEKYLKEEIEVAEEVKQMEKLRLSQNVNSKRLKRVSCVNLCYSITDIVMKEKAKDYLISKK